MDKASDYESGDSRFESWRGRVFYFIIVIVTFLISAETSNFTVWYSNGCHKQSLASLNNLSACLNQHDYDIGNIEATVHMLKF